MILYRVRSTSQTRAPSPICESIVMMTFDQIRDAFISLPREKKPALLSLLAHNLTICARSGYLSELSDGVGRKRLQAFNELLHTTTTQLVSSILGTAEHYPDEVFLALLNDICDQYRCHADVVQACEWSFRSLLQTSHSAAATIEGHSHLGR